MRILRLQQSSGPQGTRVIAIVLFDGIEYEVDLIGTEWAGVYTDSRLMDGLLAAMERGELAMVEAEEPVYEEFTTTLGRVLASKEQPNIY